MEGQTCYTGQEGKQEVCRFVFVCVFCRNVLVSVIWYNLSIYKFDSPDISKFLVVCLSMRDQSSSISVSPLEKMKNSSVRKRYTCLFSWSMLHCLYLLVVLDVEWKCLSLSTHLKVIPKNGKKRIDRSDCDKHRFSLVLSCQWWWQDNLLLFSCYCSYSFSSGSGLFVEFLEDVFYETSRGVMKSLSFCSPKT